MARTFCSLTIKKLIDIRSDAHYCPKLRTMGDSFSAGNVYSGNVTQDGFDICVLKAHTGKADELALLQVTLGDAKNCDEDATKSAIRVDDIIRNLYFRH